jgi:tellurite resistance protein
MPAPADLPARIKPLLESFGRDDLQRVVQLVTLVAYADGDINAEELDAVRASLETMYGSKLGPLVVNTLVGGAVDEVKAAGAEAFARRLGKDFGDRDKAEAAVRLGLAMARSSEGVSAIERERLVALAEGAGLTAERVREMEASER